MKIVSQSIKQRNPEPQLCTTRFNEKRRVSFRRFYLEKYTFYNQCISKLPVVSFSHTFQTLPPPYHLKTSAKLRQLNFKLLAGCQRVRFLSLPPPPLLALSQAVCVACGLDSCPKDYSLWENKAPQCALFSTFLGPDISPAAGRTLPQ